MDLLMDRILNGWIGGQMDREGGYRQNRHIID